MSSEEEIDEHRGGNVNTHSKPSPRQPRKRRILRACDVCRKRKIRCDGEQPPNNKCTSCMELNLECTFLQTSKKRGPPRKAKTQYVEDLENRVEKMEKLLSMLALDGERHPELAEFRIDSGGSSQNANNAGTSNVKSPFTLPEHTIIAPSFDPLPESVGDSEDETDENRINNRKRLQMVPSVGRFFGKSSGVMLIQAAIDMKHGFTGEESVKKGGPHRRHFFEAKRSEYWMPLPWEAVDLPTQRNNLVFPEPDLFPKLVDLYFKHFNFMFSLLHRPTFDRKIAEGLHFTDIEFGTTVILVCAIGSRFSADPRVLLPEAEGSPVGSLSAGWKYFQQVRVTERSKLNASSLFDLQSHCLWVFFMQGGSAPQACWIKIGFGIRIAQDVGRHRRMTYSSKPNVTDELWKRAFWTLVSLDRSVSSGLGRSCAIHDEDYDLDLPLEVDDEYWEHPDPEKAFVQPPGKPSVPSFFVSYLKLHQILAYLLRTIYSINKSKSLLGYVKDRQDQQIVVELDSAMNKWVDTVPDHLRWDPNREDPTFFCQSAFLHVSFYHLQILIHRPFIPTPRKSSSVTFPSLTICANAARTAARIIDAQIQRSELPVPIIHWQMATFSIGVILLLNMWGGKRSGIITDTNKELADVGKCMAALKVGEKRWHSAGRLWDVLYELSSVDVASLSYTHPYDVSDGSMPTLSPPPPISNRTNNDSQYYRTSSASPPMPSTQTTPPPLYTLPLNSIELGKLPLYHEDFRNNATTQAISNTNIWYSGQETKEAWIPRSLNNFTEPNATTFPSVANTFYQQRDNNFPPALLSGINPGIAGYTDYIQDLPPQTGFAYGQPQSGLEQPMEGILDADTMALWYNAPSGFNLRDWELFMTELTEGPKQV